MWGPLAGLTLLGFLVALWFVEPPPPDHLRLAAGGPGGAYHRFAERYRDLLAEQGLTLELVDTAGAVENLRLLAAGEVDLALAQGGTAAAVEGGDLQALASLYFEPLWVFYRPAAFAEAPRRLTDLAGRRLAVGLEDSGTRLLALRILAENGIGVEGEGGATLLPLGGRSAAQSLARGAVDAAFFVAGPQAPYVAELLRGDEVGLLSIRRDLAYRNRHRYLSTVVLGEGMIDLEANIPAEDRVLLAPAAYLAARRDLHPALIPLLLRIVTGVHRDGGLFEEPGQFPSPRHTDLPVADHARRYLENGPSFLYRILPFWVASLIDRTKILIVPLLTLLFPLFKVAPPLYRWRIRSKIYRWYGALRQIDQSLDRRLTPEELQREIDHLQRVQDEVADVSVPLSYMEEFYNLRMHISLILDKLERLKEHRQAGGATPAAGRR